MSYSFTAANGHYMYRTSTFATYSTTWSWIAWVRIVSSASNKGVFNWYNTASSLNRAYTWVGTDNQLVSCWMDNGAEGEKYAGTTTHPTSDAWVMLHGRHGGPTDKTIGWSAGNEASNTAAITPDSLPDSIMIGCRNGDYFMDGKIAMVAFYSSKLSTSDLSALLTMPPSDHAASYANCIAYWDFRTDQGTSTISDQKNSYTLTLNGTSGTPTHSTDNPTFGVTVSSVSDTTAYAGQTSITITGSGFGASQGTGTVKISPTDSVGNSAAITQTVTAWSDTSITFTAVKNSGQYTLPSDTNCYLFVTTNGGTSNASGYVVQVNLSPLVTTYTV